MIRRPPTSPRLSVTPHQPEPERRRAVAAALLGWFTRNRRDLPWRQTRDPYAIWVSEAMLQQTQVSTVVPYFERWMARFPNLATLATASEADALREWQGLGYYSRARRLLEGARLVLRDHHGSLPGNAEGLSALPGVGRYTAGAIASIAFGEATPVVDGNVVRVLTRLQGLRGDPTRAPLKEDLWRLASRLVSRQSPGDFNQAVMELGATVCSPRNPNCEACPLNALCYAHARSIEAELPELPRRPPPTPITMTAAIVERGERLLLVQNPRSAARWASLWMFPTVEHSSEESSCDAARRALRELVGSQAEAVDSTEVVVHHTLTRFRVTLRAVRCRLRRGARPRAISVEAVCWADRAELSRLPIPAAQRRLLNAL